MMFINCCLWTPRCSSLSDCFRFAWSWINHNSGPSGNKYTLHIIHCHKQKTTGPNHNFKPQINSINVQNISPAQWHYSSSLMWSTVDQMDMKQHHLSMLTSAVSHTWPAGGCWVFWGNVLTLGALLHWPLCGVRACSFRVWD